MAAAMESLSDEELRSRLLSLGQRVGPVTSTTREVYMRKLEALESNRRSSNRHFGGFSSDESDTDDYGHRGPAKRGSNRSTAFRTSPSSVSRAVDDEYGSRVSVSRASFGQTPVYDSTRNAPLRVSGRQDVLDRRSLDSSLCRPSINGGGQHNSHLLNMTDFRQIISNSPEYRATDKAYRNDSANFSGVGTPGSRGFNSTDFKPSPTSTIQRRLFSGEPFSKKIDSNRSANELFTPASFSPENKNIHTAGRWQHVSMFLFTLVMGFFVLLGYMYWNMASSQGDLRNNFLLCPSSGVMPKDCVRLDDKSWVQDIVKSLTDFISKRAGDYECGYDSCRNISVPEYHNFVDQHLGEHLSSSDGVKDVILKLYLENPHWSIRLYDVNDDLTSDVTLVKYLLSEKKQMSVWCRFRLSALQVISTIVFLLASCVVVLLGYMAFKVWRKHKEEEMKEMVKLVEKIIDKVKQQADASHLHPEIVPYLAISHVRDSLIPLQERRKKQCLWDKAVQFINTHESRIRTEDQKIEAEDFTVWRWVSPFVDATKVWQGQAFGEHGNKVQNYPPSLATCLKIRNMFDVDMEYGEDWHVSIEDAILEKCGPDHGILHIAVDRASRDGCVFVRCQDLESAGRAFKALHGWWFDGKLVTVKYLREARYYERFPEAVEAYKPVKPSNTNQLSLSQPFHSSIIETS